MKKITLLLVLYCLTASLVNAQTTLIPDANFEQALIDLEIDTNGLNGNILNVDAEGETGWLNVSNRDISNLSGIEAFINITGLLCFSNQLGSINISNNTALTILECGNNQLTSLDVSANTALTALYCYNNQLTSLDLSANTALTILFCFDNQLTSLDVRNGNNTAISSADFNPTNNPDLTCIDVDDAAWSTTNWTNIGAQTSISVDCATQTYVPDDNFEAYLEANGMGNSIANDDYVLTAKINAVTTLDVSSQSIEDLTGINQFVALEDLNVSLNPITNSVSFNVSNLTALKTLICANSQLTSLDVSNNTALETLNCSTNQLTSLDISNNTALEILFCNSNNLTSLNTSNNTTLLELRSGNNPFTTNLDVSNNTALQDLRCENAQLTSLDVSNNIALDKLFCGGNMLTSLDVSNNTQLLSLICNDNQLTSLDVRNGNNSNITTGFFSASNNPDLTCIDVDDVAYSTTNWTSIDAQTNFSTNCNATVAIPDANFEQALIDLGIDTNGLTGTLIASDALGITSLTVSNKNISDLTGIEAFTNLTFLNCNYNSLTSLDVSANTALTVLRFRNNQLTSLDVSANTALTSLRCHFNQLTSLDVSANTALTSLRCHFNQLTSLDVRNGNNTIVTDFNATNNPNLTCIDVDDATYSTTNWTQIDAQTSFSLDCNAPQTYVPDDNFEQALIDLGYDDVLDDYVVTANINTVAFLDVSNQSIADLTGIEDFVALTNLQCQNNQLISLDVSANTLLTFFRCDDNSLTGLDVSANTVLTAFNCRNNQLNSLNVKNGNNTNFTFFNSALNPSLTCIDVDDVAYSTTNWLNIDPASSFSTNCNAAQTYVPNDNFEQALIDLGYDTVLDNYVPTANINTITSLDVSFENIADLTGIEDFVALQVLYCYNNNLTSLDVSNNTALTSLSCQNNQLTSLDVTTNTALTDLYCYNNNLTSLDVSNNTALTDLLCQSNQLTSLDVSNNTALTSLWCYNNNLTSLDVYSNTALTNLRCYSNNLTSLDVSNNTALTSLRCFSNNLTSLNVKNGNNTNVTTFDATNNPNLTCIDVDDAAYSTTNWTQIDAQTSFSLDCNAPQTYVPDDNFEQALIDLGYDDVLDDYVVTANISSVISLNVSNRNIADLTGIEGFTDLTELSCQINQLSNLNISLNTSLVSLHCGANQLTNLDVSSNQDLETLYCFGNQLTSLDVSNNPALFNLNCNGNLLTSLDVSNNLSLEHLSCSSNQINNIDVSNNTALFNFNCNSNQLTSIDVSANTALTILRVDNNQLTSLDVKNGNNTNFTTFNTTNNPNLTCIDVDDAAWSTANWTNIDAQTSFSENCSIIQLSAKVYLQGAATNPNVGEETWMRDDLRVSGNIPTTSPYADALTVNASVFNPTGTNAIVDWVWVELRDENDNTVIIDSQSALLQRDGDIVATDGISPLSFNSASGNYFVAISHRNHIGVIGASTVSLSATTTLADFSSSSASAQGGVNALLDLGNGIFAIYTGDFDGNAQIQNTDATAVIALLGGSGYTAADMDVNGQIQNTDVSIFINPNIGKGQQFSRIADNITTLSTNGTHNITYTFANAQNTNDGFNDFYEVDILIESDQDFKLGSGQLYFNYNTAAFGTNVSTSGTIEYTQPTNYILGAENALPIYGSFVQNDNTTSRVSLSWQQGLSSGAITGNNVTATPELLFRIKIQYLDVAQSPTVCFEQDPLFLDQTFTACGPTTFATVDCTNFPGTQLLNDSFDCNGATLSVAKLNIDLDIKLYPNPASELVYIKTPQSKSISKVEVFDISGKKITTTFINNTINVNHIQAGVYFVSISIDNTTITKKLIIK